jgi:N-acyl-D-aspartate/D-glutamate deacylase
MLDICIRGGEVLDGSGAPAFRADVGVADGRIVALGDLRELPAGRTLDAAGLTVCPGFLDLHRHADAAVFRPGFGDVDLYQGVTTIGSGNCGMSVVPRFGPHAAAIAAYLAPVTGETEDLPGGGLSAYRAALARRSVPVHSLMLCGSGTARACVAGFRPRLEAGELRSIQALLESALAEGARGVSLGLGYAPDCFYSTAELIRLLEPLRGTGTVVSVHMRREAMFLPESMDEVIAVARALDVPLQISHLKATGKENWGRLIPLALEKLRRAREEGVDVLCDVYPYTAGSTQLMHILPPEALRGGAAALTERLGDPAFRRWLLDRLANGTDFDNYARLAGWENIRIASVRCRADARFTGLSVAEAAGDGDPAVFALDLLARSGCDVTMIDFITCEEDIAAILGSPFSYVISDSVYPAGGRLHPRISAAFTTVIREYVLRRRALTLPEAIRKMTRCPADRYGLRTKGRLEPGADADILVFDPARICARATYDEPCLPSRGMEYVLVGGGVAVDRGVRTGWCGGRVL